MAILASRQKLSSADVNKLRSIKPGLAVDFQLTFPTTVKRVRSEFIGADGRKILIFKFPDEKKFGPMRDGLYVDSNVIVRLVLEDTGEILAFKSKVKAITMAPIHAVWINYPEAVQIQGLRAEKRAQIRVPCELNAIAGNISTEHKNKLAEGMVMDISASGCRVGVSRKGREKIEDKHIVLEVSSPGKQQDFRFKSEIMSVRMDELYFYYGLRFEEKNHYTEALLERLMVSP